MRSNEHKYLFGPVASRRLGRSLGVDIVPFKTCSYDCIYCQCGKSTDLTCERKEYVNADEVLSELKKRINDGLEADYITFSGSGEPTLNSKIGYLISEIKKMTKIPVCVLTNGLLLYDKNVRKDLMNADRVIPSLDAGTKEVFLKINRPANEDFEKMVEGLIQFAKEYSNDLSLEVLLVDGINTEDKEINEINKIAKKISPVSIQLNTVYRPTAEDDLRPVSLENLEKIKSVFGDIAEIVHSSSRQKVENISEVDMGDVIALLKRRPCTPEDAAEGLNVKVVEVTKCIGYLKQNNLVNRSRKDGRVYYHWIGE